MNDSTSHKIKSYVRMVNDGWRMFFARYAKYQQYGQNYRETCNNIINGCWNGRYFQTSTTGFSEFWVRDFAYCAESLINLGYVKEVRQSLSYALGQFEKYGKIKTKISSTGLPIDIFHLAPDSLALLIRTLTVTKNNDLIGKYKRFLNREIKRYYEVMIDKTTGLVKGGYFSSVKDHAIRNSSIYDNSMIAYLGENLDKLSLINPFKKIDLKKDLLKIFWTGNYFRDTINKDEVTGDANIYPYWLEIFDDKKMMEKSFASMERAGLTDPYPLKYSANRKGPFVKVMNFLTPNYQGDTIWMQNGLIYLQLLSTVNKNEFKKYFDIYKNLIEKNNNFIELFHSNGSIYKTFFYKADEGLLWCSIFLDLANKFEPKSSQ